MSGEQLISRVITKATDPGLITLEQAKAMLKIPTDDTSQDVAIQASIYSLTRSINNYCDRIFVVQGYRDLYRYPCLGFSEPLRTRQAPIVTDDQGEALLTVTMNGGVLDPSEYDLDLDNGRIYPLGCGWGAPSIVVDYTAGFDPIPPDVFAAMSRWFGDVWVQLGRDPTVKSEAVFDVMTVVYADATTVNAEAGVGPPDAVVGLLYAYRMMFA